MQLWTVTALHAERRVVTFSATRENALAQAVDWGAKGVPVEIKPTTLPKGREAMATWLNQQSIVTLP